MKYHESLDGVAFRVCQRLANQMEQFLVSIKDPTKESTSVISFTMKFSEAMSNLGISGVVSSEGNMKAHLKAIAERASLIAGTPVHSIFNPVSQAAFSWFVGFSCHLDEKHVY